MKETEQKWKGDWSPAIAAGRLKRKALLIPSLTIFTVCIAVSWFKDSRRGSQAQRVRIWHD